MILDRLFEWTAPCSPADVVDELVRPPEGLQHQIGHRRRLRRRLVRQEFRAHGIAYVKATRTRSAIFLSCLPMLTSATVRLLDNKRLFDQLVNLNRECGKGGKDRSSSSVAATTMLRMQRAGSLVFSQTRAKRPVGSRPLIVESCRGDYDAMGRY